MYSEIQRNVDRGRERERDNKIEKGKRKGAERYR